MARPPPLSKGFPRHSSQIPGTQTAAGMTSQILLAPQDAPLYPRPHPDVLQPRPWPSALKGHPAHP